MLLESRHHGLTDPICHLLREACFDTSNSLVLMWTACILLASVLERNWILNDINKLCCAGLRHLWHRANDSIREMCTAPLRLTRWCRWFHLQGCCHLPCLIHGSVMCGIITEPINIPDLMKSCCFSAYYRYKWAIDLWLIINFVLALSRVTFVTVKLEFVAFSVRTWGNSTLLRPNESTKRHISNVHRTRDVVAVFFCSVLHKSFCLSWAELSWLFIGGDSTHEVFYKYCMYTFV